MTYTNTYNDQLLRKEFNRGYIAGQKSMDADHYSVMLRLETLRFGDDSYENLCKIANVIDPNISEYDKDSCKALCKELIRLLGGVHK